jgi:phosphatidylserine/phosphatidylglycerophosphate/cardiolipin synthase-like enzyme
MTPSKMKRPAFLAFAMLPLWLAAAHGFCRPADFEVVSSVPMETKIVRAGTRDAVQVWLEMVREAKSSVDIAEFYLSGEKGEALEPVIETVLAAGRRGVRVRILCEKSMAGIYPETLSRFRGCPGIAIRMFDWKPLTGGVLHAKYFIVDKKEAYIGSQNFDWRSLAHIHETGLRFRDPLLVGALERIFTADWQYSGGDKTAYQKLAAGPPLRFRDDTCLVASPAAFNPPGVRSALEMLLQLLDKAQKRITVQLLTYSLEGGKERGPFILIDQALRRAAGRGVHVRLLVSDWNLRRPQIDGLRALARVANINIRFAVIPQAQRGFIPFARVASSIPRSCASTKTSAGWERATGAMTIFSSRATLKSSCAGLILPASWMRFLPPCGTAPMCNAWILRRNTRLPGSINWTK